LTTALLACVVLVAACSGNAKPQVLPTLQSTPTATVARSALPDPARSTTPQGAEAFVRYFFNQLNAAFSASDASLIEPLVDPQCSTCRNYMNALRADPSKVIRGPSFAVESVAASPVASGGSYVSVFGRVPARQLVSRDGQVLRSLPEEGVFNFTVAALRVADGWRIRAIRINK
jgi:hypothetical protein